MASCFDELESNPFFKALQTKYSSKYDEAQKKLWLICVPSYKSIKGVVITQEFIDTHVLKPSPFFRSYFLTTDANSSMSFKIEGQSIYTQTETLKVLDEETHYNDDFKPYKILIIERPLNCATPPKDEEDSSSDSSNRKQMILSPADCKEFLQSLPKCSDLVDHFDERIKLFSSSYMILPHYLLDASIKLHDLSVWAAQEFQEAMHGEDKEEIFPDIAIAAENYLLHQVHNKLFAVIKKRYLDEDKLLTQRLLCLHEENITADQLGVQQSFCCQTPSAIVELASLNSKTSPSEKLQCLITTLKFLNQDIKQFSTNTCSFRANKDSLHITSDDLIPLLAAVIIQARPQYLISNLYYIQNFCWELSSVDEFSFGLVSFQAAKEFLNSSEFDILKPCRKVKKELSLEELMEATVEIQKHRSFPEVMPAHKQTSIDYQLESVTKMIEASTRELSDLSFSKNISKKNQSSSKEILSDENIGDFLSNSQHGGLGIGYGQQT